MRAPRVLALLLAATVLACSDRAQYDNHSAACDAAQRQGLLALAVKACGQAVVAAESAGLPAATKSQALYRLGRLKRQQGKFVQAEALLSRSLGEEATLDTAQIGDRLIELSLSLAGQGRWSEGALILQRLITLLDNLPETPRADTVNIIHRYRIQLNKTGRSELASRLEAAAAKLKQPLPADRS